MSNRDSPRPITLPRSRPEHQPGGMPPPISANSLTKDQASTDEGVGLRAGSFISDNLPRTCAPPLSSGRDASDKDLKPFQKNSEATWLIDLPANPDQADAILIFGGDGTVHRHLAQLVELQLPVLVVPCGSGNDFARALRLPRVRDSLAAWRSFCSGANNVRTIDLGTITPAESRVRANRPGYIIISAVWAGLVWTRTLLAVPIGFRVGFEHAAVTRLASCLRY